MAPPAPAPAEPAPALAAPAQLTADAGRARVTLNWSYVPGARSFNLYYGTSPGITTSSPRITDTHSMYIMRYLAQPERRDIMKLLLAADGSSYTKKALAWLVANDMLAGPDDELILLHVQPPLPPLVRKAVGSQIVKDYYASESAKVMSPIERFLRRHPVAFRSRVVLGQPAAEILRVAAGEKVNLVVMGTHGRGVLGRAVMGSVAQRVLVDSKVPVLLVK